MKFQKKVLTDMERCYSVTVMPEDKIDYAFFATEGKVGGCVAFDCGTFEQKKAVWEEPGGTMSMVPLGEGKGFLAVQKFYRLYDWEEAELVWCRKEADGYRVQELFTLPYLHRFDVLTGADGNYLICATLADHKATREDWSLPGHLYVAKLPEDLNDGITLTPLPVEIHQNHGFCKKTADGKDTAYIAGREGVFCVTPPQSAVSDWTIEKILDRAASDIDLIDIDGDGVEELAVIEEFHGCYYRIYKEENGSYRQVFEHPEVTEFYHVVKSGSLNGRPVFIGGCRRGKQQLFLISCDADAQEFRIHTVDENAGPSNAMIYNGADADYILSANREAAQAVIYKVIP